MLRIERLCKRYPDGTRALRDLSLAVPDGQFLVIVGLSGSGKSTLMRCVNRLVEPTSGRIWLDDAEITGVPPAALRAVRRRIGMVFQQFNLVRRHSVLVNTLTGALGRTPVARSLVGRFTAAERAAAVATLQRVGLGDLTGRRADTLSGGQQQRVAIARALLQEPRLILADEPVASLDPATSHSVLRYLEEINREDGLTVLCNLHFLSLARRYAHRVVALRAGEIVFDGPPDAITRERFRQIYGEEAVEVDAE
jgi:phosphonate transport system ATP-binding protein